MSEQIAVVVDSTLALPAEEVAAHGIRVVPVHVVVSGESLREGLQITPAEVADHLRAGTQVTTSRPAPQEFLETYREAAADGATGIVSVHLSAELSGTVEAARIAAQGSPIPVRVIDTRTITMAGGYGALDAAAVAATGAAMENVADAATRTVRASSLFFYVDTLEYLQRGGRIGAAQRYLGQALRVKPLLYMEAGSVAPLEKVRTARKALRRLAEVAADAAEQLQRPRLAVHHLRAGDAAGDVQRDLRDRLPDAPCPAIEVGAVIGVHTGPGMVAVAVVPGAAP
jgi:DegV family protein with EDD domain